MFSSSIGFIDAAYLSITHFQGNDLTCSLIKGCDVVLASTYSSILGIPIAVFGALYYLFLLLGMILYLDRGSQLVIRVIAGSTVLGFTFSVWLLYIQGAVIGAFCQYCLLSFATSSALFVLGVYVWQRIKKSNI